MTERICLPRVAHWVVDSLSAKAAFAAETITVF
ncbi:hypothetical protein RUESEDTHA_03902 [Ruegeria sp. THAF57]|nr:hypothetical protein RUESEDTHA_03902 [Ruegeria sp. THAF57]